MIYGVETTGKSLEVLKWPTKKEAVNAGNSWLLVENEKELFESSISTKTIADLWNKHNPTETVKRFADREEGAKAVFAMFGRIAITPKQFSTREGTEDMAAKKATAEQTEKGGTAKSTNAKTGSKPAAPGTAGTAKAGKATAGKAAQSGAKAAAEGEGGSTARGRASKYAGKKLTASAAAKKENPRREGTNGYNSMEIIRQNPGITYEDFLAKGGRGVDLEWDVGHSNVDVK